MPILCDSAQEYFKKINDLIRKEEDSVLHDQIEACWNRYGHDLDSNSFCYLFSYGGYNFIRAIGLDLLDENYGHEMIEEQMITAPSGSSFVGHFLSHVIEEQRCLLPFTVRKAAYDVFINHAGYFSNHPFKYALYVDTTMKDKQDKIWHVSQKYIPIYGLTAIDILYCCICTFVEETSRVPFQYKIGKIESQGDDGFLEGLREVFRKDISKLMINEIGLYRKNLMYFEKYASGKTPQEVFEEYGKKSGKVNHASIKAQEEGRRRTYTCLRKSFPVLLSNYQDPHYRDIAQLLLQMGLTYGKP